MRSFNTRMTFYSSYTYSEGYLQAADSLRAPIFYDSNDTNYYVDPNSYSYLSRLRVADASGGVSLSVGNGSTHGVYTADNARKYLVVAGDYYPHMALVASGANNTNHGAVFSFVGSEGGAFRQWNLGIANNNPFLFSIGYNRTTDPNPHYGVGDGWSGDDNNHARLSIDRDGNTKIRGMLYVNGTSGGISTGSAVIHAGNIGSQSVSYASNSGNSATTSQRSFDYLYTSSYLESSGAVYGTIFYDNNDRSYYVDPNSTSRLVQVNLGTTNTRVTSSSYTGYLELRGSASNYLGIGCIDNNGWGYIESVNNSNGLYFYVPGGRYAFDNGDVTPYSDAENSLGNGSYRWSQVYTSGWLRQYGAQGMYNQDYGTHFYSNGGSSWGITGSGGNIELQFRSNHQSTLRGYVYANTSNEIGFLNEDGNWNIRTWNRGQELYGTTYANDFRTYIIYDRNDTGYYLDMNSTSRLHAAHFNYLSVGQSINTSYRIIISGDYYANAGGNYWAEGRFKQYRGSGTWHDVIDSGNIGSQSVNYASSAGYASESYIVRSTNDYRHSNRSPDSWHGLANSWHFNDRDTVGMSGSDYWVSILTVVPWYGFATSHRQQQLGFGGAAGLYHRFANDGSSWSGWSRIYSDSYRPYADSAGNADTVDGYHESAFWRNDQTRTIRVLNFTGVGGDSGNGSEPTSYGIYQQGGSWSHPYPDLCIGYHTGIKIGAYYGYNGTRFYNNSDWATITASVNDGDNNFRGYYDVIAYASDKRLKENIEVIENALDKIMKLTGMTYTWNSVGNQYGWQPGTEREAGVFAQDVQAVLPEAVRLAPFDNDGGKSKSGENFLTVKYEKLVPLLIQAIKEQQKQIDELKSKLV